MAFASTKRSSSSYRNADGPGGKRVIITDPETAPVVIQIYERFVTDEYSIRALVSQFHAESLTLRGHKLSSSVAARTIRQSRRAALSCGRRCLSRSFFYGAHPGGR